MNRSEFIKGLETLVRCEMGMENITLTYGMKRYDEETDVEKAKTDSSCKFNIFDGKYYRMTFVPLEEEDKEEREFVEINNNGKKFYQCIEGDGPLWTLKDIIKAIDENF